MPLSVVMSGCRHGVLTFLAVCVQTFMLLQVSFFYALMYKKSKNRKLLDKSDDVAAEKSSQVDFAGCLLSCVVMVRNEELNIATTLRTLGVAATYPDQMEVILVDTGCTDSTIEVAKREAASLPYHLVFTEAIGGRGPALDAGTSVACGDIIFVIHADCIPPPGYDASIRAGLVCPGVLATAFRFELRKDQLNEPLPGASVMEFTVNIRSSLLQLPFGDQGLAIAKARLIDYGGWGGQDFPIMEEFQLVQKMRLDGLRGLGHIMNLPTAVCCSPRRWVKLGVWRVNLVNQLVMIWYRFGATPRQLFDFYYGIRTDHVPLWLRALTAPLMK